MFFGGVSPNEKLSLPEVTESYLFSQVYQKQLQDLKP